MWAFAGQDCASFVEVLGTGECDNEMYSGTDADGNTVTAHEACCACGGGKSAPVPECTDNDEVLCSLIATGTLSCDDDFCSTCPHAHKCDRTCGLDCPGGDQSAASVENMGDEAGWAVPLACGTSMLVLIAGVAVHRKRRDMSTHTRLPDDATAEDAPGHPQAMNEDDEYCERAVLTAAI